MRCVPLHASQGRWKLVPMERTAVAYDDIFVEGSKYTVSGNR